MQVAAILLESWVPLYLWPTIAGPSVLETLLALSCPVPSSDAFLFCLRKLPQEHPLEERLDPPAGEREEVNVAGATSSPTGESLDLSGLGRAFARMSVQPLVSAEREEGGAHTSATYNHLGC